MLTNSLITLLKEEFNDYSPVRLAVLLDEVQRMIFTQNATEQMRMYSTTTGKDPILTTQDGVYEYTIGTIQGFTNNAWRVYEVYQNEDEDQVDVFTVDARSESTPARIVFKENPGAQDYFIRSYRFPTPISTPYTALEVPYAYHLSHVYEGVAGLIEKFKSGRSERWEMFYNKLLPELVKKMSDGKRRDTDTPYRTCGV